MEEEKYSVYVHFFPNYKVYVGISKNCEKRWRNGLGYIHNKHLHFAILKYGWDNIEHKILFENLTKEQAEKKEIELISFYQSNNPEHGYNIESGGNHIGKMSDETKQKLSIAHKGKKLSNETKMKISKFNKGKVLSEEHKQKLISSHKGIQMSEATKEKLRNFNLLYSPVSIMVAQIDPKTNCVIDIYKNGLEASKILKFKNPSHIYDCCRKDKNRKTAYGYKWEWVKSTIDSEHIN
jgi:group I intron endonuclease